MDAAQLHKLARRLREVALAASNGDDEAPVSASELAIVEDVAHHPGTSIGEITRRTGLAQSLVSRTVVALRDAGVFTTEADTMDRRKLLVSIDSHTRLGLLQERGARPVEAALVGALPGLEAEQLPRVIAMLEELSATFQAYPLEE